MDVIYLTISRKISLLFISLCIIAGSVMSYSIIRFIYSDIAQSMEGDTLLRVIFVVSTLVAVFVGFCISLSILLNIILKNNIIEPLEKMRNHIKQIISTGDFIYIKEEYGSNDTNELVNSFNSMINIMENSKKSLLENIEESKQVKRLMVESIAALVEMKDKRIGQHNRRTQEYVRLIAQQLRNDKKYNEILTDNYIDLIYQCVPLHDIGKISIPDSILYKPGKLTVEEFEIIKKHTVVGYQVLNFSDIRLSSNEFVKMSREIAYCHHERWDGTGYPNGLKGNKIPLCARIMALADVYDALITDRIYKSKFSCIESKNEIVRFSGSHFDPDIVEAFIEAEEKLIEISRDYQ